MYLITIRRAVEEGHAGPLGLAPLASRLGVSPASANEMVRKLAGKGLVSYEPYKGASLTATGEGVADRVLRTRRLWARFLADHLGYTPQQADDLACDLEHVTAAGTADRLDEYLGHPKAGPLGAQIPGGGDAEAHTGAEALGGVPAGTVVEVVAVAAGRRAGEFLTASGLGPGAVVTVAATGRRGVLVAGPEGDVHLDPATADSVLVRARGAAGRA
ncbi:MAG: metal-dependent transcriptional regulator [Actinobacteria bacterium]|nr:metal-dependent transcriptional regulator [Actinomycetota bacterium]